MKTNFFENIASLNAPGIWTIGIQNDENGDFTVSALYAPFKSNEPATKMIVPLIHRGKASDMDEGFFEATLTQVDTLKGLYSNIKAVTASVDAAKKKLGQGSKPQPAKPKADGNADEIEVGEPKASAEEKRKAYTDTIRKVVELNDACKYEDALNVLPSVEDYPEKKEELEKRRADLERKKAQYAQALLLFNEA
ncbi:PRTRC system protein E [Mucilaginibacter paludis]|uniref:Prtrc system protein E n=1 Tax=Mucilaginibacter paludis DSM 18603 TaxID=714943 RepID=H1Y621_9SPHI|nr:PRTRC system protein E [Mucilaginibacter paludis]EHQ30980.1 prtrc system protein E [Mucilaginibacter paludis DSM 18603]